MVSNQHIVNTTISPEHTLAADSTNVLGGTNSDSVVKWAEYSLITGTGYRAHIDRLVQERRNSIANALELRLSCTNPSISHLIVWVGLL